MRCVGDEPTLNLYRSGDAGQQPVKGDYKRAHFRGDVALLHRMEFLLRPLVDFTGQ